MRDAEDGPDGPQIASAAQAFGQNDDITVLTISMRGDARGQGPEREMVGY